MSASPQSPDNLAQLRYLIGTNQEDTLTALAGGGQTGATALTAQQSRISTVASGNDSVSLPKAQPFNISDARPGMVGMLMFVRNDGANSMQVFGATPDTINGAATGTGVAVGAGKSALFWLHSYNQTTNVGAWMMLLSA